MMEKIFGIIPSDLPAWAYVLMVIVVVIGIIIIAKITSNSNKNNIGSKNNFSGNARINQQIGSDNINNKDGQ